MRLSANVTVVFFALTASMGCSAGGGSDSERSEDTGNPDDTTLFDDNLDDNVDDLNIPTGSDDPNFDPVNNCDPCNYFAAGPFFEEDLSESVADSIPAASGSGGPCIVEPVEGSLIPANWTRPRVRFTGGSAPFRVTFSTDKEETDLDVYTQDNIALLPKSVWDGVRDDIFDPIQVTVTDSSGKSSTTSLRVAPVLAGGSMVFWASVSDTPGVLQNSDSYTTTLYGFSVGEEAVIEALTPPDVEAVMFQSNGSIKGAEFGAPAGQARCVGCHTSTPDGKAVAITDHWPWNVAVAELEGSVGAVPSFVTPMGSLLLNLPWQGITTFSRDEWMEKNERVMVTAMGPRKMLETNYTPTMYNTLQDTFQSQNANKGPDELVWIDLAASGELPPMKDDGSASEEAAVAIADAKGTSWGVISRDGDANGAVTPDWSHDGSTIVYTSTDSILDGHVGGGGIQGTPDATVIDLYTVPYAGGNGGAATPVSGASENGVAEYYPDFSADDRFIAFNRVPTQTGYMFYRPDSEIHVVPAGGGDAVRLAANDTSSCDAVGPGALNSWPKWSPLVRKFEGKTYYFLIFSSARNSPFELQIQGEKDKRASQLYMTAIVENEDGSIDTFPAVYVWSQEFLADGSGADANVEPLQTSNLTPAWDDFVIPPVKVVIR